MKQRGFTLIETMVYLLLLVVVIAMAGDAFMRCLHNSSNLQRNVDDITRSLHAGERWRNDIRNATGAPEVIEGGVRIPQSSGAIEYTLISGTVWRRTGPGSGVAVVQGVKSSTMQKEVRQQVTAWRWELELASPQKVARVRPLFSFETVAAGHS